MVNSKGKLLKLALILTRLSVQSSPQLLLKLSIQLSAARCTGKQVLRLFIIEKVSTPRFLGTPVNFCSISFLIRALLL